jgi:hypothetical protein
LRLVCYFVYIPVVISEVEQILSLMQAREALNH